MKTHTEASCFKEEEGHSRQTHPLTHQPGPRLGTYCHFARRVYPYVFSEQNEGRSLKKKLIFGTLSMHLPEIVLPAEKHAPVLILARLYDLFVLPSQIPLRDTINGTKSSVS